MKLFKKLFPLLIIALIATPATAHAHQIGGSGFASGITHPLLGLDHLLAMVAVGVISTQTKTNAIWKVPATFVVFMIIGAFLAISGLHIPIVETGIALSVLILGIIIALTKNIPTKTALLCVAFFAVFHGHAHGSELPVIANAALYAIGFTLSTITLHIAGILIGHFATKTTITTSALKFAGAGMSLMGIVFLL